MAGQSGSLRAEEAEHSPRPGPEAPHLFGLENSGKEMAKGRCDHAVPQTENSHGERAAGRELYRQERDTR